MARIRTIKPQFWRSPDVMELSYFGRLLYIGLWNLADDEGRGAYEPASIAADIFLSEFSLSPHGVVTEVSNAFKSFHLLNMVVVYEVDSRRYFQIVKWTDHQKINRPSPSQMPPPTSVNAIIEEFSESSVSPHAPLPEASRTDHGVLTDGIRNKEGREISEGSVNSPPARPAAPEPERPSSPEKSLSDSGAGAPANLDELAAQHSASAGPAMAARLEVAFGSVDDPRCAEHKDLPRDRVPACRACARAREVLTAAAETAKADRQAAIDACDWCDDRGLVFDDGLAARCEHGDAPPVIEPAVEEGPSVSDEFLDELFARAGRRPPPPADPDDHPF